ncbi:MAG: A/G-specific adenine glycosylase [Hyphomicrobiales bacterium]|nr:MAG: A/G-specific adenine glycosylase [Hyphomicrobiales bacterium]
MDKGIKREPKDRADTAWPEPADLLAWYDRHARTLPWRVGPKARASGMRVVPYHVWLSEIMLQQTTVQAVKPYFENFLSRWPTLSDLAAADEAEVMAAWAGLGYYSRARNLVACARVVAEEHGGVFPDTEDGLRGLPGIGPYTAAAIAAIALDRPATVVDGNVERVVSRLFAIPEPLPQSKPAIRAKASLLTPDARPGDFAQAMMDLGATICTKRPACALCPWMEACEARAEGSPKIYPLRAEKKKKPTRHGAAFVAVRAGREILLRRRPPKGLLGGMTEVPGNEWAEKSDDELPDMLSVPFTASWKAMSGTVRHTFTHFHLELTVYRADVAADHPAPDGAFWARIDCLKDEALPTVMRKAVAAGLGQDPKRKR